MSDDIKRENSDIEESDKAVDAESVTDAADDADTELDLLSEDAVEPEESDDTDELMMIDGAEDFELYESDDEYYADQEDGEPEGEETPKNKKVPLITVIFEWVEMFAIYLSVGIAVLMLFVRHCPVSGSSMENTLMNDDLLILSTFAYTPENGDIIVCQSEKHGLDHPLVKRVIATEGQTVKIDYQNWKITVDGVELKEDYVKRTDGIMKPSDYLEEEFTVPEGHIFVMGDNRNVSWDSRSEDIGFIDERYVVGKVWIRLLPFSEFTVF